MLLIYVSYEQGLETNTVNGKDIETRMRRFEKASNHYLSPETPAIIRIDGRAFHTFTKNFDRPYDYVLIEAMQHTMLRLCQNTPGCRFGYTQSDEISLILTNRNAQDAWFDWRIEKLCSVTASMASTYFTHEFEKAVKEDYSWRVDEERRYRYLSALGIGAVFDARVFNIPREALADYIAWRQTDASRNSLNTKSELHGAKAQRIHDMLHAADVNWNDQPTYVKRGTSCLLVETEKHGYDPIADTEVIVKRMRWRIDRDMPIIARDTVYLEEAIRNAEQRKRTGADTIHEQPTDR